MGLALTLVLTVAACGAPTSGGGGGGPAPTPTTPPSPTPCTTWGIVSSPNDSTYPHNTLTAVSALSPTAAWAVGYSFTMSVPDATLIEQWDGTSWQVVANPGGHGGLYGVAAVSPTDVWAVGALAGNHPDQSLILHWNGTQWSIVPSSPPNSTESSLNGVVALATNDVWAVGQYISTTGAQLPLVEHWDGTAWHAVATPSLQGVSSATLNAVTRVPGTTELWAVGWTYTSHAQSATDHEQVLIERWNGAAWHVVSSPTLPNGSPGGILRGVVALSAGDAWAVGMYYASDHPLRILIAHWDGVTWKVAANPDVSVYLASVAAVSASDVRAVGSFEASDRGPAGALIEQWNGAAWQMVTTPVPSKVTSGQLSQLSGITTDGTGHYWAVGWYNDTGQVDHSQALILHCP